MPELRKALGVLDLDAHRLALLNGLLEFVELLAHRRGLIGDDLREQGDVVGRRGRLRREVAEADRSGSVGGEVLGDGRVRRGDRRGGEARTRAEVEQVLPTLRGHPVGRVLLVAAESAVGECLHADALARLGPQVKCALPFGGRERNDRFGACFSASAHIRGPVVASVSWLPSA